MCPRRSLCSQKECLGLRVSPPGFSLTLGMGREVMGQSRPSDVIPGRAVVAVSRVRRREPLPGVAVGSGPSVRGAAACALCSPKSLHVCRGRQHVGTDVAVASGYNRQSVHNPDPGGARGTRGDVLFAVWGQTVASSCYKRFSPPVTEAPAHACPGPSGCLKATPRWYRSQLRSA